MTDERAVLAELVRLRDCDISMRRTLWLDQNRAAWDRARDILASQVAPAPAMDSWLKEAERLIGGLQAAVEAVEYTMGDEVTPARSALLAHLRTVPVAAQVAPQEPVATVHRGGTDVFGRATALVRWELGSEQLTDGEHKLYAVPVPAAPPDTEQKCLTPQFSHLPCVAHLCNREQRCFRFENDTVLAQSAAPPEGQEPNPANGGEL